MPTQREIDRERALREKEFMRSREKAAQPPKGSTVIKPRKQPTTKKTRYADSTFCALLALLGLLIFGSPATAVEIELKPQPCYNVLAYTTPASENAQIYALIFDQCKSEFKWIKVPKPPEHEV